MRLDALLPRETMAYKATWTHDDLPIVDDPASLDLLVRIATNGNPAAGDDARAYLLGLAAAQPVDHLLLQSLIATTALLPAMDNTSSPLRTWHEYRIRPSVTLRARVRPLLRAPYLPFLVQDDGLCHAPWLDQGFCPPPKPSIAPNLWGPSHKTYWIVGRVVNCQGQPTLTLPIAYPEIAHTIVEHAMQAVYKAALQEDLLVTPIQAFARAGHLLIRALYDAASLTYRQDHGHS